MIIYSIVSEESFSQQKEATNQDLVELDQRLTPIKGELQIANVVPAFSPSTRRVLEGKPPLEDDKSATNAFSDDLFSFLSNPDISVTIYNRHEEIVFNNQNGNIADVKPIKEEYLARKVHHNGQMQLVIYKKVRSQSSGKLTGYMVIRNKMSYYNDLMDKILKWMGIISIIAIIFFVGVAFLVVNSVVKPIKEMSLVAHKVNDDPNSTVRIKPFKREDELQKLAISFNQMLDRMQSYIAQQKEFVGDVSHELRTPVAVIEGHLSMLERWGKDDPEVLDEAIKASLQESKRMQHLIQEMLDLTRAEQIDVQYPDAVSNVSAVLKRVVSDLSLIHKDFVIELDLDDLPDSTTVQIYQGHLEQILVILIDNAVKYSTDRRQVNVAAGLLQDEVNIMVQDFGEGISAKEQAKIFNRFYRVDKARTREKGGNGLGLAIAQKLVTSYRGKISVDSVEGQGSQFKIAFPMVKE